MRLLPLLPAVALSGGVFWAGCVGDDPSLSSTPTADSGVPDSADGASPSDSATSSDAPTDSGGQDAGDAALPCINKTIAYYPGNSGQDFFGAINLAATNGAGFEAAVVQNGLKPSGGFFRSAVTTAFGGLTDFTVELWIRYAADTMNIRRVLDYGDAINGWLVQINPNVDFLDFSINNAGSVAAQVAQDGEFHHVAFVLANGSAPKAYVDGVAKSTGVNPGAIPPAPVDSKLTVGADAANMKAFDGVIDELAIYSAALSENEIKVTFDAKAAGRCRTKL